MRKVSTFALFLFCLAQLRAGVLVERIAATVDGHIILASEVNRELAYQCMIESTGCRENPNDWRAALDRLINRQLISEQMGKEGVAFAGATKIDSSIATLKAHLVHGGNASRADQAAAWKLLLAQRGLNEEDVESRVRSEIDEMRFVEARFRPEARVSSVDVQEYYEKQLLPKLPIHARKPELTQVEPQIREILTEQSVNRDLDAWLTSLREHAKVEVR